MRKDFQSLSSFLSDHLDEFKSFQKNLEVDTHATTLWSKAIRSCNQEAFKDLTDFITQIPEFKDNDRMLHHGLIGAELNNENIAEWLIWRALKTSIDQATGDLQNFLKNNSYPAHYVSVLSGISISYKYNLDKFTSIIPYENLEDDLMKFTLNKRMIDSHNFGPDMRPGVAIITRYTHPKRISRVDIYDALKIPKNVDDPHRLIEIDHDQKTVDTISLMTLVGPSCPIFIGSWDAPNYSVPYVSGGFAQGIGKLYKLNHENWKFGDEQIVELQNLIKVFYSLSDSHKIIIIQACGWLHDAIRFFHTPKSAIFLGTALESLFLEENSNFELKYRLSLRVARALGKDLTDRQKIFKQCQELYNLRSFAVHNGKINIKKLKSFSFDLSYKLVSDAIKWRMNNMTINWSSIELA